MIANYEDITQSGENSFAIKLINEGKFPFHWHYNNCYELTLIVSGRGRRYIGDNISEFDPDELVLISPQLPHAWVSFEQESNCEAIVLHFNENFGGEHFFNNSEMESIKKILILSSKGLIYHGEIVQTIKKHLLELSNLDGWRKTVAFITILGKLSASQQETISTNSDFSSIDRISQDRFSKVCGYINANFTDPELCQSLIAKQIHMSRSRFSQFFRQVCGRSYIQYLNELRISYACQLLIETDKPITGICFDAGFNNIANFNRHFRKIKACTPRQYRDAFANNLSYK